MIKKVVSSKKTIFDTRTKPTLMVGNVKKFEKMQRLQTGFIFSFFKFGFYFVRIFASSMYCFVHYSSRQFQSAHV